MNYPKQGHTLCWAGSIQGANIQHIIKSKWPHQLFIIELSKREFLLVGLLMIVIGCVTVECGTCRLGMWCMPWHFERQQNLY